MFCEECFNLGQVVNIGGEERILCGPCTEEALDDYHANDSFYDDDIGDPYDCEYDR